MQVSTPSSSSTSASTAAARCVAVCASANTTCAASPPVRPLRGTPPVLSATTQQHTFQLSPVIFFCSNPGFDISMPDINGIAERTARDPTASEACLGGSGGGGGGEDTVDFYI